MKKLLILILIIIFTFLTFSCFKTHNEKQCFVGGFIADSPTAQDILQFQKNYGKALNFTMIFCDWSRLPDKKLIEEIERTGSQVVLTWEPWITETKTPVDFDKIIRREYDDYIDRVAQILKSSQKPILLRFAHEMNGDWYPWSCKKIPPQQYQAVYVYIWHKFLKMNASNVKWIFSVNWENVPYANFYYECYPGDEYVDAIGIDGYNWGTSQESSRWMGFKDIFEKIYKDITVRYDKPIIITEFGTSSAGGDKAAWIQDAFNQMQKMSKIAGIIIFNQDKETDWKFPPSTPEGNALKEILSSAYFY